MVSAKFAGLKNCTAWKTHRQRWRPCIMPLWQSRILRLKASSIVTVCQVWVTLRILVHTLFMPIATDIYVFTYLACAETTYRIEQSSAPFFLSKAFKASNVMKKLAIKKGLQEMEEAAYVPLLCLLQLTVWSNPQKPTISPSFSACLCFSFGHTVSCIWIIHSP